jgi:tetratricopeptide (TPR) repeat protein
MKTNKNHTLKTFLAALCFMMIGFPAHVSGQVVTFELEVPEGVLQSGDVIELRGNISENINWDEGLAMMRQDGRRWNVTLPAEHTFLQFEYKFLIVRANGHLEWEEGTNRIYTGEPSGNITGQLRGFGGAQLANHIQVAITLDLTDYRVNGHPIEEVMLQGGRAPLGWDMPDHGIALNSTDSNTWSTKVVMPAGSPADVPFKFAWKADGVWYWEHLPGHVDHLMIIHAPATSAYIHLGYNHESGRVEAIASQSAQLDNYEQAAETYRASRRYRYFRAIELLEDGEMDAARQLYDAHRNDYPPVYIDDFEFIWAHVLAGQERIAEALIFVRENAEKETNDWRRAYFHYLEGEILLNSGQVEAAQKPLEQALALVPEDDTERQIEGYALLGLAQVRMQQSGRENNMQARPYLMRLAHTHPDEQTRRLAWQLLASMSLETDDESGYERAMEGLQNIGSPQQRMRSRIEWTAYRMLHEAPDLIAAEIELLETEAVDTRLTDQVSLLKAEFLIRSGIIDQAEEILRKVELGNRDTVAADRARNRLRELRENN